MAALETPRVRASRSDGIRTRRRILDAAVIAASSEGLYGLTIGTLAGRMGISKSGLYAHFGSKEALQVATIRRARSIFAEEVLKPGLVHPPGRAQLSGLSEAFLSYLERGVFPGGCFFASAAAEVGTHPGRLRTMIARHQNRWLNLLERLARQAQKTGEIKSELDPSQVAFELNAVLAAANTALILHGDKSALASARRAISDRLER